ncbi:MAG: translocation/assembly module TamB domain-containing protein, partial [Bacteroidaceae bacterium]|nr:translocation/assembly module TamB domain-containing protein [Bacteroidaceae bacterium]
NVGASHSNSTVGVDCILNFSGKAAEPKVAFDIDFPKANNDENLLLKKFILTEEDRNMQAVYLLSIGRFYTYNYNDFSSNTGGQNQSTVAMTSFLAGTLSGQINNILQDAFHITNWNFGTSIAAGRMGFGDMEVQGSLSGKMFNNRLLFNGNIGYRDQITTYSNNFVGDFNLQWLLNKAGTISLKAYSETNDRYFTKSSLTTQGGGILFQKDFNKLRDFFRK